MDILVKILSIVAFAVVVLILYNVLKAYVLDKVKVNKWIILVIAVFIFMVPMIIWPEMPSVISLYVIPGIFVLLFLWFMDLSGFLKNRNISKSNFKTKFNEPAAKRDKKKDVVIKPKAKPNRVKNNIKNK